MLSISAVFRVELEFLLRLMKLNHYKYQLNSFLTRGFFLHSLRGLFYLHVVIDEDYKNVFCFAITSRQSVCDRSIDQSYIRTWVFAAISSIHPTTLQRLSILEKFISRVLQLYACQPIMYSAYESLNAISI